MLRFSGFALDEAKRSLRRGRHEVVLQPRVFDLLTYLATHRDRVVSKDELVDAVWEGAFVADGAVQRAVSLARAALRDGAPEAIRTYPRQGYRFCCQVEIGGYETPADGSGDDGGLLRRARDAFAHERWEEAAAAYGEADGAAGLTAGDLERWGQAVDYGGRSDQAVIPLQRAVAAHAAGGDHRAAARAAVYLANLQLEQRDAAVAAGWQRRAARYLEADGKGGEACRERGLLEWLSSRLALFAGKGDEALEHAERALELGRSLDDGDLEALGLLYSGLALCAAGESERGMARMDEAAAMVLAGQTGPWEGGLVFCGVIWGCLNRGDWRRAGEWTDQFSRWIDANAVAGYPGLCQLHRAEVLTIQGELAEAEREAEQAREVIAANNPWAEGDAFRLLGEIRLARGDLEGAETAFRAAHELGWDPNPGHALLQVARGQAAAALRSLERALDDPGWASCQKRGPLLAHLVVVACEAGRLERARQALAELEARPTLCEPPGAAAMAARARGELALAEGHPDEAVGHFRDAVRAWLEVPSPCNVASVRLRLAAALAAEGDPDAAELELSCAETIFDKAELPLLVEDCNRLRASLTGGAGGGKASPPGGPPGRGAPGG